MLVFRLYPYVSPVCLLRKPEINVCSKFYSARGAGASCLGVNLVNVPYSVIIVLYAWVAHVLLVIECCYKILLIAPIKLYLCGFCVFIYFFLFNYPFVCLFLFRGRVFYFFLLLFYGYWPWRKTYRWLFLFIFRVYSVNVPRRLFIASCSHFKL